MIRVNQNEQFPITVSLIDGTTEEVVSGETVTYDIRNMDDSALVPPVSGTLTESTVELGIYRATISLPDEGNYILYATADSFTPNTEEIIVLSENIYDIAKQSRHYNLSIEDVVRTNETPTASQTVRNVPLTKTDYVITRIKSDDASDWSNPVSSGIVYAHYETTTSQVPYKMGGPL